MCDRRWRYEREDADGAANAATCLLLLLLLLLLLRVQRPDPRISPQLRCRLVLRPLRA